MTATVDTVEMYVENTSPTPAGNRKVSKSVMEKKRRARINTCVSQLKGMLAGHLKHQGEKFDKLEKADILEYTVNYIKQLQYQSRSDNASVRQQDDKYEEGFNACVSEVYRYVGSSESCDTELKTQILSHLADSVTGPKSPEKHAEDSCLATRAVTPSRKPVDHSVSPPYPSSRRRRNDTQNASSTPEPQTDSNNNGSNVTNNNFCLQSGQNGGIQSCDTVNYSQPINVQCPPCAQPISTVSPPSSQPISVNSLPCVSYLVQNGQLAILVPANILNGQFPVIQTQVSPLLQTSVPSYSPTRNSPTLKSENIQGGLKQIQSVSPSQVLAQSSSSSKEIRVPETEIRKPEVTDRARVGACENDSVYSRGNFNDDVVSKQTLTLPIRSDVTVPCCHGYERQCQDDQLHRAMETVWRPW